jgi:hypothetical protein
MTSETARRADEILDVTRRRIEIFGDAGDAWRFAASLKSISEDAAQEYEGRAVLELIQNGHDAIGRESSGRIHVVLDLDDSDPTLYVANDGAPFSSANFLAIIGFGLSDKSAGEGIGNKGLGFRSVLRLTDCPEVYSRDPDDPADRGFSGYSFRFLTDNELAGLTEDEQLGKQLVAEVSPLDLPVPAVVEDPQVLRFASEGFATVIKLPLRDGGAAADARRQIDDVASAKAPILLFLSCITSLELAVLSPGEGLETVCLTRSESPASLVTADSDWVRDVDLGMQGRYLLARRQTSPDLLRDAIRRSVAGRQVDARWLDWDGEAWVGVAIRLDEPLGSGTVYTFLPMKEPSPLAAHVHAPFFTKLARREFSLDVPLNSYLMGQIAATCLRLLRALRDTGDHATVAPLVVDLSAWSPPQHQFLVRACVDAGSTLETEQLVPVAGQAKWSSFIDGYVWPTPLKALSVVSAEAVAALGYRILDPRVGVDRQNRLVTLHRAVLGTEMEATAETLAVWVESLADSLRSPGNVGLDTWASFYDDLAVAFSGRAATALRGRSIILDQDSRLRPAMGSERDDRRAPQLFFAPSVDDEGTDAAAAKLPRPLATRIVYTHADIPWTIAEPVRRRRPGRNFLESNGLVREYRTDQLLAVLRDLLTHRPSDRLRVAALEFGCTLHPTLNEAQQAVLADVPFAVPTVDGRWLPASDAAFSQSWETEGGILLGHLLDYATDATPSLRSVADRLIASPADWPTRHHDQGRWATFLRAIGVHDGLPLTRVAVDGRDGGQLRAPYLSASLGLAPSVAEAWERGVARGWHGGTHPYTRYRLSAAIAVLPGAGEVEALDDEAREIFARLLARGLTVWPNDTFDVTVSRPERRTDQQDPHRWPTPVSSYLRQGSWIPVEGTDDDDGDRAFVRPADAWLSVGGPLPRFVPPILQSVRSVIGSGQALRQLRALGIRVWDEPQYCGDVLRQLPELLEDGHVAPHYAASFKKQCRLAWDHLVKDHERWPWGDDETPIVVVTEHAQVRALSLEPGGTAFVPDETDQTKQALFGLTPQPVLVVDPERGQAVADLMREHELGVVPTSDVTVEVFGDDQLITPGPDLPALVADDRQWVTAVVALVAELKAGPFTHPTEQSIRQLVDRLRKIRLVRVGHVRLVLGEDEVEPPEQATSLPIDDEASPTVVAWVSEGSVFEELEQCAESIASLIGQPQLAAALQLTFARLGRYGVAIPTTHLDDQILAQALQVSEGQIRESRADLRGPLFELLDRIRVLLAYFGGVDSVAAFDVVVRGASDEGAITEALAAWNDILPVGAAELVTLCTQHPGFADLRDALDLDFGRFNDALAAVDPPHPPLRHPERHERAMARFVEAHEQAILNRLREAYAPVALDGGDLTAYGEARNFERLEADPAWLETYAEPPDDLVAEQVGTWLAGHGASADLTRESDMADVSELRSRNFERLDDVVRDAEIRIRAWARNHGSAIPAGWTAPMSWARSALERSYRADFSELSVNQILDVVAKMLGWPDEMLQTLDLAALGLNASDLLSRDQADAEDRRRRQHDRTHLQVDGHEVSVDIEHLGILADSIAASLTEELLGQSGKATLAKVPSARKGGRPGGSGLAMARVPHMSDEQRTGVGLIGEVVARAWLERHYANVEWVSGYRNIVLGDDVGSDSLGYDFVVQRGGGRHFYYEVKAHVSEAPEIAEFELGETEVLAAQRHRDAYRILLLCSALDSTSRRILELPNPLGVRGAGRYTLLGRGLRYRCAIVGT